MTLSAGDVVDVDLGSPIGREAGFQHPAILVTAQRILDADPAVLHVVPATSRLRRFASEIEIAADAANGLDGRSAAQCQHVRAVAKVRVQGRRGNVGSVVLAQIREVIALVLDVP